MIFSKKKWGYFIFFLFFIIISLVFAMRNNLNDKDIVKDKEEIEVNKKQFGMYVENEDGEFVEYADSELFPDISMYTFNEEKSYCVDNKDNVLENVISYDSGKVTVTSNKTIYCTLYFNGLKDDLTINVSTDGVDNVVPTNGIYETSASCSSGNAYYNPYYQRLEIGGFKRGTKCTLDYTKDTTSYTLLSSVVQSNATTNENGYRYSGGNPDNYVWFNNELWRIIGLIPVCTTASNGICSTRTNLIKIIRAEPIGSISYDVKASGYTGLWGNNTLYTLLNSYYYGKLDGTGTDYCYSDSSTTSKAVCDYTKIGISSSSTDYYGKMVEDVYWNINASSETLKPATSYSNEINKVTTSTAKIGLMSISDYGYAAVVNGYSTLMSSYNTAAITSTNWLYGQGTEATNTQRSSYPTYVFVVNLNGLVSSSGARAGYLFRPVLYLDPGVYKISGSGKVLDPFVIGM